MSRAWKAASLAAVVITAVLAGALPAPGRPGSAPIDPQVRRAAAEGKTTFWVILDKQADLSRAEAISDWTARGQYVVDTLRSVAAESQRDLRALLTKRGVSYESYWIINALRVSAGEDVLNEVAAQNEVGEVKDDSEYEIPPPGEGDQQRQINGIEWNIDRVNAPDVWSTFGVRGEGAIVANIDTGVQYRHPAVVNQYRGNLGGGTFDHNYNWFDPSRVCGRPISLEPCDNADHGTHTMGTMVGDDGGTNEIGVAPGAEWIAAKGCESFSCSTSALLRSGEWVLAPTDLNGQNPRADLRPNVVNNSWGGAPGDPFYRATVQAWIASGIFPAFSQGNSGPSCGSANSPGDYPESYGAGAFDINNRIAFFSSRGPSSFGGELKPNIAAPGVDVRSSVPGGYDSFDGTSMASPHVAGTVALMISAAPALAGDVPATAAILDDSALDVSALNCGGTLDDNNIWGEGALDAFAAVDASPRGPSGWLAGRVTDAGTGSPIVGAEISITGPSNRVTTTDSSGEYNVRVPVGTYDMTVSAFGYLPAGASGLVVTEGNTTTRDFALTQAPSHVVSGFVRELDGTPIAGATVTILGTPIPPQTTNSVGFYRFSSVPEGTYDVLAKAPDRCLNEQTREVEVDEDEELSFVLTNRTDDFGYFCEPAPFNYLLGGTVLDIRGDDDAATVNLPFAFPYYGASYTRAAVSSNGFITFTTPRAATNFSNYPIPTTRDPDGAIYALWDDLVIDPRVSNVRTGRLGRAPNRRFIIEWRNVAFLSDDSRRVNFEIVLYEDGRILTQYQAISGNLERGASASVGIENADGTDGLQYSFNEPALSNGLAILYRN